MSIFTAGKQQQKTGRSERRRRGCWWSVLGWASGIAILVIPYLVYRQAFSSYVPPAEPLATLTLTRNPPSGILAVWTTAPAAHWDSAEPLPLRSFFSNSGSSSVTVRITLLSPPGCTLDYHLKDSNPTVPGSQRAVAGPVSIPVKPQSGAEAVILIDPSKCPSVLREAGVPLELDYTWTEPAAGKTPASSFAAVASVSPIIFAGPAAPGAARRTQAIQAGYAAFKDLSWPVVMLLFGVILKKISDYREEAQSRRSDRQQILTNLLPEYLRLVQEHYMPITRRIETVAEEWGKTKKNVKELTANSPQAPSSQASGGALQATTPPARQLGEDDPSVRLLAAILLLRSRSLVLLLEKGGVFFRTSIGENLFAVGFSEFFTKCRSVFGTDGFESAALALDPKSTLPESVKALLAHPNIFEITRQQTALTELVGNERAMDRFDAWIKADLAESRSFDRFVNLLKLCGEVLLFECDRIFYQTDPNQDGLDDGSKNQTSGWYFDPPQLEISSAMLKIPAAKPTQDSDEGSDGYSEKALLVLLQDYMSRIPEACKVRVIDGDRSSDFDALMEAIQKRLEELKN